MKRHLMTLLATVAGMAVLTAVGETYEPGKVYGPIVMLGDEPAEIDGHGAIIDGGGEARCATLGPNVTLRNFTFRNGKAAVGGSVWGGKVVDCTISGCMATEYGAAVADCTVSSTKITGCQRLLDGAVKAAMHGGIAADSALDGVTITDCRVELGTTAPGFGGIAANSSLVGCTVTDNTLVVSGDHYGLLFYGGSLKDSTISGNSVDSSAENIAAYMKVKPDGCTLDGGQDPTPPGPTPPDPPQPETAFEGNANYGGYLMRDGVVWGTVVIKAAKPKNGESSVKLTVQPLGGKKETLKKSVAVGGSPTVGGLTYTETSVDGTIVINGYSYQVTAPADALTSTDRDVKAEAKLHVPGGTWTFAWADAWGVETCFSATVAEKTGKTKLTGFLPNGKKVSLTATATMGLDLKTLSIPVVYSKQDVSFAFLLEVDIATRVMKVVGLTLPDVEVTDPLPLDGADDASYVFRCPLEGTKYLTDAEGMLRDETVNVAPDGVTVNVFGGKWTVEKTVGSVKLKDRRVYVKYTLGKQQPANVAKLKLKWANKTGIVSGTFTLYYMEGEKLKTESATVNGVTVGREMHGLAYAKKSKATFPVDLVPVPVK